MNSQGDWPGFKNLHNKTDIVDRKRLIRALEIEVYYLEHPEPDDQMPGIHPLILGINFDRLSQTKEDQPAAGRKA